MATARYRILAVLFALCLLTSTVAGQQKDPRVNQPIQPIPPVTAGESSSKSADDPAAPAAVPSPDTKPLSGTEAWTLGNLSNSRNLFVPTFRFFQIGDTNSGGAPGSSHSSAVTTISGQMGLQHLSAHRQFFLDYRGGATVYDTRTGNQTHLHGLDMRFVVNARRATFVLGNSFTFLPESGFGGGLPGSVGGFGGGFGGTFGSGGINSGLGGFGGGVGGNWQPGTLPSQTIFNGTGSRFVNTVIGQMQFNLSRRASITTAGTFGMMRFLEGGLIESNSYQFRIGYDYQLTGRDTLAVTYGLGLQRFQGVNRSLDNHNVMLSYGRKITGRLAWQIGGGPRVNLFENQLQGSGTNVGWTMRTSLLYSMAVTTLNLAYDRSINSGSGVFLGAETDRVSVSIGRPLSRMWNAAVQFGYAHNKSLRQLTAGNAENTFNSFSGGISLNRPVGRKASMFFVYNAQYQRSNVTFCAPGTTACGTSSLRHHFGLGFTFGFGPYEIE